MVYYVYIYISLLKMKPSLSIYTGTKHICISVNIGQTW
jgi:hypothetical protein